MELFVVLGVGVLILYGLSEDVRTGGEYSTRQQNAKGPSTFSSQDEDDDRNCPSINPGSGLPMTGCHMDIEGNPYGTDLSDIGGSDPGELSAL